MKLHQIRDVLAVARSGSLRAAARSLSLAQPTLSKTIASLEDELGLELFERRARGMVPTAAGEAFLARAEVAWHELERARGDALQVASRSAGSIAVGIGAAPSLIGLARAMRTFRRDNPGVWVRIVNGNFPTVLPELRSGALDFSIGPRPGIDLGDEFVVETLLPGRAAVVARRGHPLAGARSLAELLEMDWILTSGTGMARAEFERFFTAHGLRPPRPAVDCEYVTALLALLAGSDMLALLPRPWVESDVTRDLLVSIEVREPLVSADVCVVRRSRPPLTHAARGMLTLLRRECEHDERRRQPGRGAARSAQG